MEEDVDDEPTPTPATVPTPAPATTGEIIWRDPPASIAGRNGGARTRFVEVLKTRPGTWALFPKAFKSSSCGGKTPGVEWASRRRADGLYDLYGRWIGDTSKAKP